MELQELLSIIYGTIGTTLVPAFTVFIGFQVNKFVQSKVSKDKQAEIDHFIKSSVVWVEQITGVNITHTSSEKLKLAKERARLLINQAGLDVSEEYLDTLIEMFVNQIEWNKGEN